MKLVAYGVRVVSVDVAGAVPSFGRHTPSF